MIATTGSPPGRPGARPLVVAFLAGAAAIAMLLRALAVSEPLGIDQSLWASAVRGMDRGQLLYRDVWEQRPPGIYWIYLAGFRVFGWTPATVPLLDLLASAATTLLLVAVARALERPGTGLLAAALYAVLTMPAWLYRHSGFLERSVSETFIVVFIAASALCAVQAVKRGGLRWAAGVGFAAGAAVVLKPNAGLYFPALLLWMALARPAFGRLEGGWLGRALLVSVAASAAVPLVTLLWLWRLDLLDEARVAVIDFNRYYVGEGFSIGVYAVDFSKAVWLRIKTEPLWLAGSAGAVAAIAELVRKRQLPPVAALAVLWGGAAALVIVVNGARLFNSYFINAHAPLALLGAWFLTDWAGTSRLHRALRVGTVLLMAALLVQRSYLPKVMDSARADLGVMTGRLSPVEYLERFGGYANDRGYSARANAELAAYVAARTQPDDRIFLFGINGAGVYFAANRLTAHRFLRVNFFVETDFPDPRFRLDAVVDDLSAAPPAYLIFERLHSRSRMGQRVDGLEQHASIQRLLRAYRLETRIEDFSLYRRTE